MTEKACEFYGSVEEFEEVLDDAERNAETSWEMQFVVSTQERYEQWGIEMFLSEKQNDALRKIAGAD